MQCSECRQDNPTSARFCQGCGRKLALLCAGCGAELGADARFCAQCGRPTSSEGAPGYTPRHLAERILTSRGALEGERKQVTVLFVDLVDSTALAERLGPESMHELLDRILRLMAEAVHRYDGTVNQFLGDGLMALFGAPVALEDHALRAVHAAFAIQETIGGLNEQLVRERGAQVQLRIGLNTGLVVVGKIGDDLRMDYTAVGDTTNLAARMQAMAAPGTIVATKATHRLVEPFVRSEALGGLTVKGVSAPVTAFRLTGRRRRTRFEASAERGLTPLVGRQRELDLLTERFTRAAAGRGQIVGIVAEPGAGKSRLLHEFRRRLASEAAVVLQGHCVAWGETTPYLPLVEIVRASFAIEDGDNPLQVEEKLRQGLAWLGGVPAGYLPMLRALMGLTLDPETAKLDPKVRRLKTFEAVRALTLAASQRRPHIIVVEDLHWIDTTSAEYFAFVADSLAAMPLMLVTTSRPGHAVPWADRAYFTQIALDLLDERGTGALLTERLGTRAVPPELVRLVHDKADGNPLFVEEIVGALLDRGALRRNNGGVVWAGDGVEVPASGRDIIRARIDHLPEPVKRTLQTAAVIGRHFSPALLTPVTERPEDVGAHLEALKRLELVHETRFFPEVDYAFRHALIQDVAYDSLLERRRRELHAAVGRALEELLGAARAEQPDVLAHHFSRGNERDKAFEYLVQAGDRAAAAFANREAVSRYEAALGFAEGDAARATVLAKTSVAALQIPDPEASRRFGDEAVRLFEALGDKANTVSMRLHMNYLYSWYWDGAQEFRALDHLQATARLVEHDPDSLEKALVYQRVAHQYMHRGRPSETLVWARQAVEMLNRVGVRMGTSLGTGLTYTGYIDEGFAYAQEVWPLVAKAVNPLILAVFGHDLVLTLTLARRIRDAIEWGERVAAELIRVTDPGHWYAAFLHRPLALAYTLAGRMEQAVAAAEAVEAIDRRTRLGCVYEDAVAIGLLRLRHNDLAGARRYLETEQAVHRGRYTQTAVTGCSFGLAVVLVTEGDRASAAPLLQDALRMSRAGGNVLFELWVAPVLADLHTATGAHAEAAELIDDSFKRLASGRNFYGLPAPLHVARARLGTARRQWDAAESDLRRAVETNREHGLPWDEAVAHEAWADLCRARGAANDQDAAREHRAKALALFTKTAAAGDVARVRAALG